MPRLFVLMPFSPDLEPVYERLFKEPFEKAGYDVSRAKDIDSQRNILEDIIESVRDSDLILADLTDLNANVFYELGIAHAFDKNVVLVSQEISSLPFDLQSYRVVRYSTSFTEMEEAVQHMEDRARKIISGGMKFANPVADFADSVASPFAEAEEEDAPTEEDEDERRGILDFQADFLENVETLGALVGDGTKRIEGMSERVSAANERITGVEFGQPSRQRRTIRDLGFSLEKDAAWFKDFGSRYYDVLAEVEDAVVGMFSTKRHLDGESREELILFIDVTEKTESQLSDAAANFQSLIAAIDGVPKIERRFDRGSRALARELETYIDNIELSIAVITRSRNLAKKMLGD
ncbi:MAG: hypothetical protein F4060_14015 [Holophagales bacterium]|nr:hypothetical protein [Holophagales bacterium]MYG30212.1 hypothetical protein [Holophagales bacterium]MYI81046.1 hypothetical protein [Holophagales bacterium]